MSLEFSDLPPSANDNTYDPPRQSNVCNSKKNPEHFQWEGNVDASAEMPEIFQTEKGAFQSQVELSHGKVINFDTHTPPHPPYFDRKKDN